MRTSAPSASSAILVVFLASAGAAVAVAIGACADPDTQTPTCTPNVDEGGIFHAVDGGCEQFAQCDLGPASACCTDDDGGALTGNDLATCLYGYGDPSCVYLLSSTDGLNVTYTCSTTPDAGAVDGGVDAPVDAPLDGPLDGAVDGAGDGG
jgi:hypothetical protein